MRLAKSVSGFYRKQGLGITLTLVLVILILLVLVGLLIVQWKAPNGFLPEGIRDFGVLVTLLGLILGLIALASTIVQVVKTKDAAVAASTTAKRVSKQTRVQFRQYTVAVAQRLFTTLKEHVRKQEYEAAILQMEELANHLGQMAHVVSRQKEEWFVTANELRSWANTIHQRKASHLNSNEQKKWDAFVVKLGGLLDRHSAALRAKS